MFRIRMHTKVVFGPKENGHRPAIDTLFRSAAEAFGPRVIGVILTGASYDGAAGLAAIKERGGIAIVQDPDEALEPSMPLSALRLTAVDHVLLLQEMGPCLSKLTAEPGAVRPKNPVNKATEPATGPSVPAGFSCPACGGVLREEKSFGSNLSFRCHVGHTYTMPALEGEQSRVLEETLWRAVRTLRERATLQRRLAERTGVREFLDRAEIAERDADTIQAMLPSVMERPQSVSKKPRA